MAYVIEFPVDAGGRMLVQVNEDDLPGTVELASLRPDDVVQGIGGGRHRPDQAGR